MKNINLIFSKFTLTSLIFISSLLISTAYADITVTDSRGEYHLPSHPSRVVALNWDLAEQVLELGVTPVGVPNIKDYHTWVVKPAIPSSTEDVGTRMEPNLEKIASLNPDVILVASPQKDLISKLEQIAPVLYYQSYNAEQNSAQAVIENFKRIAQLLGKDEVAEQKLAQMEQKFADLKAQLAQAFNNNMPSVVAMRFANTTSIFLYAENSTTDYVLKQLGLTNALPQPAKEWGIVQKRLTELQHVNDAYVIYFGPFDQQAELDKSMIWQMMPFVKNQRNNVADAVWNYGGAMSMQYIAESISKSLLELAGKH